MFVEAAKFTYPVLLLDQIKRTKQAKSSNDQCEGSSFSGKTEGPANGRDLVSPNWTYDQHLEQRKAQSHPAIWVSGLQCDANSTLIGATAKRKA